MQKALMIILSLYTFQLFAQAQLNQAAKENKSSDIRPKSETSNDKELSLGLYIEACSGHVQAVQLFIEKGANVELENEDGKLPIHCASQEGHQEIVEILLKGTPVDAKDGKGRTALHYASYHGHIEVIRLLLEKGADVNAKDFQDRTPFHYANQGCKPEVLRVLHNNKADEKILDKDQKPASDYYCNKANPFFN